MADVLTAAFLLQLTVYLGKRDFVDHVDRVEPVGEAGFLMFSVADVSQLHSGFSLSCFLK